MEGRRKYLFRCNFLSCSESTEIWHADSFCVKKCPCVFFSTSGETRLQTRSWKSTPLLPPPPPFSNGVKHTHAQCFSSQWSKSYNVWRWTQGEGGGGGFSCNLVHISLPSWKKNTEIFQHKKNRHTKFQWIPSISKNRNEIGTYASLPRSPSIMITRNYIVILKLECTVFINVIF